MCKKIYWEGEGEGEINCRWWLNGSSLNSITRFSTSSGNRTQIWQNNASVFWLHGFHFCPALHSCVIVLSNLHFFGHILEVVTISLTKGRAAWTKGCGRHLFKRCIFKRERKINLKRVPFTEPSQPRSDQQTKVDGHPKTVYITKPIAVLVSATFDLILFPG